MTISIFVQPSRDAAMSSSRPMSTRQFEFPELLKSDNADALQAASLWHTSNDRRRQDSPKRRLLFAIKRDLQAASGSLRDSSTDSLKLLETLESVRCAPPTSNSVMGAAIAVQLSQSVALIERFVVDQLPQGSAGDDLLAAWNCVVAHSVRAAPLMRHARPRAVEQLRCKAESTNTTKGETFIIFRHDNASAELTRASRIEELLSEGPSRERVQIQTHRATASSPRARFIRTQMPQASSHISPRVTVVVPVKASASDKKVAVSTAPKRDAASAAAEPNNGHFERLIKVLGCGDQRVQTRELNKELDTIRESLKLMKGRIAFMTENLDAADRPETPTLPLEPDDRSVGAVLKLQFNKALNSSGLQALMYAKPATGLRDVTGVDKLLQMHAEELKVLLLACEHFHAGDPDFWYRERNRVRMSV